MERVTIAACFVLLLAGAAVFGFIKGKKSGEMTEAQKSIQSTEVVLPTAAVDSLIDEGFREIGEGNRQKALFAFQKAQSVQPSLTGIDYLVGFAALQAGENILAEQSLQHALSKNEMSSEARVLIALIALERAGKSDGPGQHLADPLSDAETELRRFAAANPADAAIYCQWAEALRLRGSYRTAEELLHKGVLRADPASSQSLLSAKEALTRLQREPSKEAPSLSGITSMSGEQALAAALAALQQGQKTEALLFFERAREFYTPRIFREIIRDPAFDEYRTDSRMREFLKESPARPPGAVS